MRAFVYEVAIGGVLIVGLLLAALSLEPDPPVLPEWGAGPGPRPALAGVALWLWTTVTLVARGDGTPLPLDPPTTLVVSGPAGEALLFRSVVFLGFVALLAVAVAAWSRHEEREFEARFDDAWRRYRQAVPAWFPRLRSSVKG